MKEWNKENRIVICMGSSCFSRGNSLNLELIREHLRQAGISARVELSGQLCQERCSEGPNLMINGRLCTGISRLTLPLSLEEHLASPAGPRQAPGAGTEADSFQDGRS